MSKSHITRRAALAPIAAIPVVALAGSAVASVATIGDDAELIALGRQFDEAAARYYDLNRRVNSIVFGDKVPIPPIGALTDERDTLTDTVIDPLTKRIGLIPATTIAGLAVKARVVAFFNDDLWIDDMGAAIAVNDLDMHQEWMRRLVDDVLAAAQSA